MNGYMGKLLRVDMTHQMVTEEPLDEGQLRQYLGGRRIIKKILMEETDSGTDPLSGDNILILMTGPFAGTNVPCSGRHTVIAKSPLTGIWGEANVGGSWGVMLKRTGYDGVVVKGIASEPLYLWINNGNVEFRTAAHIWGKDSFEVDEIIKNETDPKAEVTSIGQAGENLVSFACVMNDGKDGRAAGRCGLGAVMGSKRLKAIAVFGNQSVAVSKPEELKASIQQTIPAIKENAAGLSRFGTSGGYLELEIGAMAGRGGKDNRPADGRHDIDRTLSLQSLPHRMRPAGQGGRQQIRQCGGRGTGI
jgi:aldehyde:ferredoxin oxidoreductase